MNPEITGDSGDVSDEALGLGYPEAALRAAEEAEEAALEE
jgi:hypothetical protein